VLASVEMDHPIGRGADEKKILSTLQSVENYLSGKMDHTPKFFDTVEAYTQANSNLTVSDQMEMRCLHFYKKHLMDFSLSAEILSVLFWSFYKTRKDDALDIFGRWRDSITFLKGVTKDHIIRVMRMACALRPQAPSNGEKQEPHEMVQFDLFTKFQLGVLFYELGILDQSCEIFAEILSLVGDSEMYQDDEKSSVPLHVFIDCCKFLYITESCEYRSNIQTHFVSYVLMSEHIQSDIKMLAVISLSGREMVFRYRSTSIPTDPDISFLKYFHFKFIFDCKPDKQDAVRSCTFLLKAKEGVTTEEVATIEKYLIEMGSDKTCSESVRATALGCLVDNSKNKSLAFDSLCQLKSMGYDSSQKRFKTIYDSSQNVHEESISSAVSKAITNLSTPEMMLAIKGKLKDVLSEIEVHLCKFQGEKKFRIKRTLNRLIVDETTFGKQKVTLSEILCMVWYDNQAFLESAYETSGKLALKDEPSGQPSFDPSDRLALGDSLTGQFPLGDEPSGRLALGDEPSGRLALGDEPSGRLALGDEPTKNGPSNQRDDSSGVTKEASEKLFLDRFFEELDDMDNSIRASGCSDGYGARLINSLACVSTAKRNIIQISWKDQIKSNIQGRLYKRMRDLEGEAKDLVLAGMMESSTKEEFDAYRNFMESCKTILHAEMRDEFVGGGYLTAKVFDAHFDDCYELPEYQKK
jgi:hypothetical protein